MLSSLRRVLPLFLLITFIISCGNKNPEWTLPDELSNASKKEEKTKLFNKRIVEGAFAKASTDDYKIGPGDLLEIAVYEASDLNNSVRVNSKGMVTYLPLGEVELGGLNTQEAEQKLKDYLGAKYLKDPHVSVFIKEYRSKKVAVVGAIANPGSYELLAQGSLLDVLALAGGLRDDAGRLVYLTRQDQPGQIEIDLDQLLVRGNTELNLPVRMGDLIFIPEAGVYYVNGAVNRPGEFRLKDEVTVSEALQIAGGKVTGARDIKLLRFQDGERSVVSIDLDAVEKGKQKDISLQDHDVIYVSKNPLLSFFQTISIGYNFFPFSLSGSAPR